MRQLAYISLIVADYDEAIAWFCNKLDFRLVEDKRISESKRWVLISPGERDAPCLLLAKASTPEQTNAIGNQSGGRVFLFLQTDDFWNDYASFRRRGVEFLEEPREEDYGTVVVFRDLAGNKWDLLQIIANESLPSDEN